MASRRTVRKLLPRDYLVDPHQFGAAPDWHGKMPTGGDVGSQRAALVQHRAAMLLRRSRSSRRIGARVGRLFGFSRQYWSDCLLGGAWMHQDALLAALAALLGTLDDLDAMGPQNPPAG